MPFMQSYFFFVLLLYWYICNGFNEDMFVLSEVQNKKD